MHVARDRRRAYLGIPDAGNQCRAALPGANTRSACRTAAVRPRRGRLFLRRRVRGHLPRSDGEDGAGTPRAFRHGADRGRDRPAGGCPGVVRPRRRRGLHPRHGLQFVLVPGRRNRGKRPAAGVCPRRRGQRCGAGTQPGERYFQRAYPPAGGVPRGAWADL